MAKPSATTLSLATLGSLNGGTAEAVVNAALAAAIRDVEDRGEDNKSRKVMLTVILQKIGEDGVAIDLEAKTTLPAYRTESTIGRLTYQSGDGHPDIEFQPMSRARADQTTIPYEPKEAQ